MKVYIWLIFFLGFFDQIGRIFRFSIIVVSRAFMVKQIIQKIERFWIVAIFEHMRIAHVDQPF